MKQRRCPHCDCKLVYYGHRIDRSSTKWVHTGSLTVCRRVRETAADLNSAIAALRLYRIKFACSDVDGWDAGGNLKAKNALLAMGEPGITFFEACRLVRDLK